MTRRVCNVFLRFLTEAGSVCGSTAICSGAAVSDVKPSITTCCPQRKISSLPSSRFGLSFDWTPHTSRYNLRKNQADLVGVGTGRSLDSARTRQRGTFHTDGIADGSDDTLSHTPTCFTDHHHVVEILNHIWGTVSSSTQISEDQRDSTLEGAIASGKDRTFWRCAKVRRERFMNLEHFNSC